MDAPSAIARSFLLAWKGSEPAEGQELDAGLKAIHQRGREAWPRVLVELIDFSNYLGERAADDVDARTALARLHGEDLYLACGCAQGDKHALSAFDEHLLARLPVQLGALCPSETTQDELRQLMRQNLFVSERGTPAKIRAYQGRGTLNSWVRMVAVRTQLNLIASEKTHASLDDERQLVRKLAAPGDDLEMDYLKARYRRSFSQALRRAFEQLPERDRNLLRFQYLDCLPPAHIGRIYGVHRTTSLRWLAAAQEQLFAETRRLLGDELSVSPEECDSLLALVRSRLDVTLRSLFQTS